MGSIASFVRSLRCAGNPLRSVPPLLFNDFRRQIDGVWDRAVLAKQIKPHQAAQRENFTDKCHTLYLNAYRGRLPFMVLGWEKLCVTPEMLYNFGVLTTGKPFCSLPIEGPVKTEMNQGAVLSQEDWSVTKNDSYILGTVHAGKEVHLYEPEGPLADQVLWVGNRPRVLGRELMMLKTAGYRRVQHSHRQLGRVFALYGKSRIGLEELIASAEKIQSLREIHKFLESQ